MIEIETIHPTALPFPSDEKIFHFCDEEGYFIGEPSSYDDFIKEIKSISGVNEELMGK